MALEIAVTPWRLDSGWTATELCHQACWAEQAGFHSFWLPENHFGDKRSLPSPLTLLAAVAGRTSTLGLATTSYLLPIRNPIQAAEEVAVLDQLSQGRVILGVGRGIQDSVFRAFELPVAEKRNRFAANLEKMYAAWRGESLVEVEDGGEPVCLAPLPVQQPHPPIWVAAFGPLALKQAGGLGLPYLASPIEPLAALSANYALHAEALAGSGHAPATVVPMMRTILISENPALVRRVREKLAAGVPSRFQQGAKVEDWALVGDRAWVYDRLHQVVETLGTTHLIGGGRLPAIEETDQLASHEALLAFPR